jgi:DNA-binding MarR family transcriptional regulator
VSSTELLDGLLATLEHCRLPPTDARLLLRLAARDATPAELSEALEETPVAIERATRRLDMRGLIRRRFERGRDSHFVFSITSAGLVCLDPLVVQTVAENEGVPSSEDTAHVT